MQFFPWEYYVKGNSVVVCRNNVPLLSLFAGDYLSFVLMTASIVGLYLTIITHLLFAELRNLPGLNLLAMNTSMVLYQQLFLATSNIANDDICRGKRGFACFSKSSQLSLASLALVSYCQAT